MGGARWSLGSGRSPRTLALGDDVIILWRCRGQRPSSAALHRRSPCVAPMLYRGLVCLPGGDILKAHSPRGVAGCLIEDRIVQSCSRSAGRR
ncbi:hypothetical protein RHA1_ro02717 [Rhodococcus jostii RHA1]|uniref:Uncharacterized protein n=1 Tax=Rhodococcus jostii (strain RHA1) TaxID=101510 RepID=Q0SD64_RHOJR|nr:hypothetical protein RHA1_ro02717 [Rhodococcus jostii RHA1]